MPSSSAADPLYVKPVGSFARVMANVSTGLELLIGPAIIVVTIVLDLGREGLWAGTIATVCMIPFALVTRRITISANDRTRRLEKSGVPAVAEVTSSRSASVGEGWGVEVGLHITGDGLEPVDATLRCDDHPDLKVGTQLPALVDPADHAYALQSRLIKGEEVYI